MLVCRWNTYRTIETTNVCYRVLSPSSAACSSSWFLFQPAKPRGNNPSSISGGYECSIPLINNQWQQQIFLEPHRQRTSCSPIDFPQKQFFFYIFHCWVSIFLQTLFFTSVFLVNINKSMRMSHCHWTALCFSGPTDISHSTASTANELVL